MLGAIIGDISGSGFERDNHKSKEFELTIEQMNQEKELVHDRLMLAIKQFDKDCSKETIVTICRELTYAYIYNITTTVPMKFQGAQRCYAMYRMDDTRFAYVALTDPGKDSIYQWDTMVTKTWKSIIRHAATNTKYDGLIINPDHTNAQGAILYLSRDNLKHIIQYAEETINDLPESLREEIKKTEFCLDMKGEKKSMNDFLNYTVRLFAEGHSPEAGAAIREAFTCAYLYNLTAAVPMINLKFAVMKLDETRYSYVAQTMSEDAGKPLGEGTAYMKWSAIMRLAAEDTECTGLSIDPDRKTPWGANLFLNRKILHEIIMNAEKIINDSPEFIREEIRKGI